MKSIRVAAAVIRRENTIFATEKGYGNYKGWWEFPGGKIEEGETPRKALKREIEEELDTEVEVGNLICSVEYDYPEFHGLLLVHGEKRRSEAQRSFGLQMAFKGRALQREVASCRHGSAG